MKNLLGKINNKLDAQGGFLRAVSVLVGGTAFAQVIGLICLPILTRLYTPQDYSVLGVYVAIVSILAVISCLRLDIAIPIPESDGDGKALLIIALIFNTIFVVFLYILLFFIYPLIKNFQVVQQLSIWIWLIPFGAFLSGLYSALQYWAVRRKRFKDIAQTRITQSLFSNGTSLTVGATVGGFWGLIFGQILSVSGGLFKLSFSAYKELKLYKTSDLKIILYKYQKFPKFSTFEALANTSAVQLPLIIIASFTVGPEVGYLMLAMKVLGIPMGLIGSSMSQVYLSHAPEYFEKGTLYKYTVEIIKKIFKITVIPFLLLALVSPYIFSHIFGSEWKEVGFYITLMIPWYFMQIMSSPVSMSLHVIGEQKIALYLQFFGFFLRVLLLVLVSIYFYKNIVFYYIFSGFLFYLLYLIIILFYIKSSKRR